MRIVVDVTTESWADMNMEISRGDSRTPAAGPADYFTGDVSVLPLFGANEHRNAGAGQVTFTACARSAWHTHPAGQTLVVTAGTGWVQEWDGDKHQIDVGDVIWTPPGVKHWHGATPAGGMTHIAITGVLDGNNVEWMEKVTDDQYLA
jgi:quercetin dioxygenase-like cupin family protein